MSNAQNVTCKKASVKNALLQLQLNRIRQQKEALMSTTK